jgi:hypothetical protein
MTRLTGSSARHAKWIILLSIVAGAVWALIIATGALNTTNSAY